MPCREKTRYRVTLFLSARTKQVSYKPFQEAAMIQQAKTQTESPFVHINKLVIAAGFLCLGLFSSCSYMQPSSYSAYSTPDRLRVDARGMAANNAAEVNTSSIYMNSAPYRQPHAGARQNSYRNSRYRNRGTDRILNSTDSIVNNALNTTVREINRAVTQAIRGAF